MGITVRYHYSPMLRSSMLRLLEAEQWQECLHVTPCSWWMFTPATIVWLCPSSSSRAKSCISHSSVRSFIAFHSFLPLIPLSLKRRVTPPKPSIQHPLRKCWSSSLLASTWQPALLIWPKIASCGTVSSMRCTDFAFVDHTTMVGQTDVMMIKEGKRSCLSETKKVILQREQNSSFPNPWWRFWRTVLYRNRKPCLWDLAHFRPTDSLVHLSWCIPLRCKSEVRRVRKERFLIRFQELLLTADTVYYGCSTSWWWISAPVPPGRL